MDRSTARGIRFQQSLFVSDKIDMDLPDRRSPVWAERLGREESPVSIGQHAG